MKILIIVFSILIICNHLVAQKIVITKKNNEKVRTQVANKTDLTLYTDAGPIRITDIGSVYLLEKNEEFINYLNAHKILFTVDEGAIQQEVIAINNGQEDPFYKMDKFARQRNTGKSIQLVGMLGAFAGGLIARNNSSMGQNILAVSGVAWMTGFVIDWDASRHLIKREGRPHATAP